MNKLTLRALMAALLVLGWFAPLQAQEEKNEGIARTVVITAKDGHDTQLIDAITAYHKQVAQHEGHMRYTWYRILTGPDTGKYVARTSNHNWSDFDAEYDWEEAMGKLFRETVAPHVEHMEVHMTQNMNDMSHWPDSFEGYTHFSVANWYVKGGQYGKFRAGFSKIVETLKASDFAGRWGVLDVVSGGRGGQIQLVMPSKGWAGMSEKEPTFYAVMSEALGGEEAFEEFMSSWGATFESGEDWVVELMPEASDYGQD